MGGEIVEHGAVRCGKPPASGQRVGRNQTVEGIARPRQLQGVTNERGQRRIIDAPARIFRHRIGRPSGREQPSTEVLQELQLQQDNRREPQPARVRPQWPGSAVPCQQEQDRIGVEEDHRERLARCFVRSRRWSPAGVHSHVQPASSSRGSVTRKKARARARGRLCASATTRNRRPRRAMITASPRSARSKAPLNCSRNSEVVYCFISVQMYKSQNANATPRRATDWG